MEEENRKKDAKKKEESWALMRESVAFLRTIADKWRERRIDECDKIREEEKKDRLAIAKEKKRKYGLKVLKLQVSNRICPVCFMLTS